jgi:hypothetical protein
MRLKDRASTLGADERGGYQVEYLVVLILVAIVTTLAITTVAAPLVLYHDTVRESVTSTVP